MHPTMQYEITKARIADLRRQAGQDAIARGARREHRALTPPPPYPAYPAAGLARRVFTSLAGHGRPTPARSSCQPSAVCQACG